MLYVGEVIRMKHLGDTLTLWLGGEENALEGLVVVYILSMQVRVIRGNLMELIVFHNILIFFILNSCWHWRCQWCCWTNV